MHRMKAPVLILLVWKLMCLEADGEKACSCYTFESDQSMTWQNARASCKYNKKDLLAMETEKEWQFIKNALKNRTTTKGSYKDEWHIGLFWSLKASNWTWVNGKPLTIMKWRESEPNRNSRYALIAKESPGGSYGKFDSIRGDIRRAWICEEETDTCEGVCMHHNLDVTTIATPRVTATTKERTSFNIADPTYFSSDITTLARTSSLSERKTAKKDSSTVVIVATSLGTVLFVALIALTALVLLKRRRRHSSKGINAFLLKYDLLKGHDILIISLCHIFHRKMSTCCVIGPVTMRESNFNDFLENWYYFVASFVVVSSRFIVKGNQPENSYECIDPVEAAKLGAPNTSKVSLIKTEPVEYDMVNKKEGTKQNNRDHVGVTKQAPPKMDHEYDVVNKKNQKQKKGDLLYAQLDMPQLDDAGNNTKVRKPAPYAPTVYADVKPTGVINKAEPNSKLPTYENVQKTTVGV